MARIEKKAHYVGTWREDKVTDDTMRQIVARSLAEKGHKVKVKLSAQGLVVSKTVLLQENLVLSQALKDVYFLTVNQRHPCCLLCIVADPVRKYLIVALRTSTPAVAQDLISTFKTLKDNPTIETGNVVLRRKDNGYWTLRERSQHNADRQLQEIFKEEGGTAQIQQPNGDLVPVVLGTGGPVADGHRYRLVPEEGVMVVTPEQDVDGLSQELQDVRLVIENTEDVDPGYPTIQQHHNNNNDDEGGGGNNNNTDKPYYIETEILTTPDPQSVWNGEVVEVHSGLDDSPHSDPLPGEVRVAVDDHRDDGVVRAHSNGGPVVVVRNGSDPQVATSSSSVPEPPPPSKEVVAGANNGYSDIPDYRIHRRVSTEYVQVAGIPPGRVSQGGSLRSSAANASQVSFDPRRAPAPAAARHPGERRKFRSLKASRVSSVPMTVVRPIEQVYRPHPRHVLLPQPLYAAGGAAPPPEGSVVYVPAVVGAHHPQQHRRRRARPHSVHVMDHNELKVFRKTGELEDVMF